MLVHGPENRVLQAVFGAIPGEDGDDARLHGGGAYHAVTPPSTMNSWPVQYRDASLDR